MHIFKIYMHIFKDIKDVHNDILPKLEVYEELNVCIVHAMVRDVVAKSNYKNCTLHVIIILLKYLQKSRLLLLIRE